MKVKDIPPGRQFTFFIGPWAPSLWEARELNADGDKVAVNAVTGEAVAFDPEMEAWLLAVQVTIGHTAACSACGKACRTVAEEAFWLFLGPRRDFDIGAPLCVACSAERARKKESRIIAARPLMMRDRCGQCGAEVFPAYWGRERVADRGHTLLEPAGFRGKELPAGEVLCPSCLGEAELLPQEPPAPWGGPQLSATEKSTLWYRRGQDNYGQRHRGRND